MKQRGAGRPDGLASLYVNGPSPAQTSWNCLFQKLCTPAFTTNILYKVSRPLVHLLFRCNISTRSRDADLRPRLFAMQGKSTGAANHSLFPCTCFVANRRAISSPIQQRLPNRSNNHLQRIRDRNRPVPIRGTA